MGVPTTTRAPRRRRAARVGVAAVAPPDPGTGLRPGHTRSSSWSPTRRPHRSKAPASASITRAAPPAGQGHPQGGTRATSEHHQVPVAERHVDGEAHPEGVDRPGAGEDHGPVVAVPPEQALGPLAPVRRPPRRRPARPRRRSSQVTADRPGCRPPPVGCPGRRASSLAELCRNEPTSASSGPRRRPTTARSRTAGAADRSPPGPPAPPHRPSSPRPPGRAVPHRAAGTRRSPPRPPTVESRPRPIGPTSRSSTPTRADGRSVMIPSTPRPHSASISASSSMVHTWTASPGRWATSTNALVHQGDLAEGGRHLQGDVAHGRRLGPRPGPPGRSRPRPRSRPRWRTRGRRRRRRRWRCRGTTPR